MEGGGGGGGGRGGTRKKQQQSARRSRSNSLPDTMRRHVKVTKLRLYSVQCSTIGEAAELELLLSLEQTESE